MKVLCCMACLLALGGPAFAAEPAAGPQDDKIQAVIEQVEKECLEGPNIIYTLGHVKAKRLAELVRKAKPKRVVECGTAHGYSGLWIARELKNVGQGGKLITIEIDPKIAKRAEENFRKAGLQDYITIKVGDARKVVRDLEGPFDFVFLDCDGPNYLAVFEGIENKLAPGATIVAENTEVQRNQVQGYLKRVREKYDSREEWFDVNLPWCKRDAMEISVVPKKKAD